MRKGSYSEELVWMSIAMLAHLSRKPVILLKFSVIQLRVAIVGVLDADATGRKCEASPGTVLRFKEMDAASYTFSTLDPVSPCGRRTQSTK